jgi:hypothetical protein
MQARWRSRVLDVGRAFEGLDGFCEQGSGDSSEEVEIIPFLMQSNGGRLQGEAGIYQQYGLAAETARLHIKGFLFIHFSVASDEQAICRIALRVTKSSVLTIYSACQLIYVWQKSTQTLQMIIRSSSGSRK